MFLFPISTTPLVKFTFPSVTVRQRQQKSGLFATCRPWNYRDYHPSMIATRAIVATALATLLAYHGHRKKSLSKSGAAAAFAVGFFSFLASYRFGVTLILFYQSSSSLTKYKSEIKKKIESDFKEGGQRDYVQVLSCSILATILALVYMVMEGEDAPVDFTGHQRRSFLLCAYLGHYACCNGDTWASELGVLNKGAPRLVTTPWRKVPAGTNGGMSTVGTAASLAGGLFIGVGFALLGLTAGGWQSGFVWLGALGGLGGSLLDSLMGATLEATYYDTDKKMIAHAPVGGSVVKICGWDILSGEQVNAISTAATTFLCGFAGGLLF